MIVAQATDGSGNVGFGCCTVVVPHDQSEEGLSEVAVQAEQAVALVEAGSDSTTSIAELMAPLSALGWTRHGLSDDMGPHQ